MAKGRTFAGFSPKMLTFFRALAKNNDRDWFAAHKSEYETFVKAPMVELVGVINDRLRSFAAAYVSEPAHRAIYRIYRDTRFSKDKTPYKTHVAAHFQRAGITKNAGAGFYFAASHEGLEIGGGMYMPGPEELKAVRDAIAARPAEFARIFSNRKVTQSVGPLLGDKLKRLPKGYEALTDSPAEEWLRAKQWYWFVTLPKETALSPKLADEVVSRFKPMRAGVEWLNDAVLAARGEEEGVKRPEPMW